MSYDIKRGVSLYSFQEDYYEGRRTLEQCIAATADLGAVGIETLAEQMMPGFPRLSDEFYDQFAGWMTKYGTVSVAHDMFLDTKRYKDRLLTDSEMIESLKRDIDHAYKLKASAIRIIVNTPPAIVEAAAPYARDKGIKMGVEVHSPWSLGDDWIQQHLAVADRVGTDVVGCVPDLGIFVRRFPRIIAERAVRDGADEATVAAIIANYDDGGNTQAMFEKVEGSGADPATVGLARTTTHYINGDPAILLDYIPYIVHVHAKFYEMTEDGEEYSIPYDEIIGALKKGGFRGYLNSEYEGNRHIQDVHPVDSYGQLKLHQQMMARYIEASG